MTESGGISAEKYKKLLDFAYLAYQENNSCGDEYRQDGKVPFVNHPIWCATLLLTDTEVPWEERELGFQALVLHDVLEDTALALPDWVDKKVKILVEELTFAGDWDEKKEKVLLKPINVKLLLLLDGLSSMYEYHVGEEKGFRGSKDQKKHEWKKIAEKLVEDVEAHYGNVRTVQMAKAIIKNTDW